MKQAKVLVFSLLALAFVSSSLGAVDYTFYRSTVDSNAIDSNIYFEGLNQSADYNLVRDDGNTVASFTSSSTGVRNVTFDFKPIADGYTNITGKGFKYELKNNGNVVKDVYLSPSPSIKQLDTFDDGTINKELWSCKNKCFYFGEESGSTADKGRLRVYFTRGDNEATLKYDKNVDENQDVLLRYKMSTDGQYGQFQPIHSIKIAGNWVTVPDGEHTAYITSDRKNKNVKLYVDGSLQATKSYGGDSFPIALGVSSDSNNDYQDYTRLQIRDFMIVGDSYSNYNISGYPEYSPSVSYKLSSYSGGLDFDGSPNLQFNDSNTGWTSLVSDLGLTKSTRFRNTGNGTITSLNFNTTVIRPPDISNTKFSPKDWKYRSDVDFETTITDPDGVVDKATYDVYAGNVKIVDNASLSQTSNPDVYETPSPFSVDEDGKTYKVVIKAWDNGGNKETKTYTQDIPSFITSFDYSHVGYWTDYAITPKKNATGFTMGWTGFNSSKVNYTYATMDIYLESLDRDLNSSGYDVYLQRIRGFDFINQTSGNDIVNGSNDYNLTFSPLDDYDKTNKILGDEVRVIQRFNLRNSSGDVIKVLEFKSEHETLEADQSGLFEPFFDAIGSALRSVGDFLGITDLVTDVIDEIINLGDVIVSPIEDVYNAIVQTIENTLTTIYNIMDDVWYTIARINELFWNAITYSLSAVYESLHLTYWNLANAGLTVEGTVEDTNETFTYYNYTGDYPKRLNDTSATFKQSFLQQYSLNGTYTSKDYRDDKNISLANLNATPILTLYNASTTDGRNDSITINYYTVNKTLPNGVSVLQLATHEAIKFLGNLVEGVLDTLPDSLENSFETFIDSAGDVGGLVGSYFGIILSMVGWIANKGFDLTIMLGKLYVIFTGLRYGEMLMEASEQDKSMVETGHMILSDVEKKYMTVIDLFEKTYNSLQTSAIIFIHILRGVKNTLGLG